VVVICDIVCASASGIESRCFVAKPETANVGSRLTTDNFVRAKQTIPPKSTQQVIDSENVIHKNELGTDSM